MESIKIPKYLPFILNQLFEIESKLTNVKDSNSIQRNVDKMKNYFETEVLQDGQGLAFHNPIGETYDETRTDCEASISGESHENLRIIEVLKPIIYFKYGNIKTVVQRAVVIVESKIQTH